MSNNDNYVQQRKLDEFISVAVPDPASAEEWWCQSDDELIQTGQYRSEPLIEKHTKIHIPQKSFQKARGCASGNATRGDDGTYSIPLMLFSADDAAIHCPSKHQFRS